MSESTPRTRMIKVISEHLGVEPDRVTDDANFIDDLGADSLDIVELTMAMEEEFNVEVPDDEMERLNTVAEAISLIESKLNG